MSANNVCQSRTEHQNWNETQRSTTSDCKLVTSTDNIVAHCKDYAVCQLDTLGNTAEPIGRWDSNAAGKIIGNEIEISLGKTEVRHAIFTFICDLNAQIGKPTFLHESADKSFR